MFVLDHKKVPKRIHKAESEEYLGLRRYTVPQGVGKITQTLRPSAFPSRAASGVQGLFKSGHSVFRYEATKVHVSSGAHVKPTVVFGHLAKDRSAKKSDSVELTSNPMLSMDAQRNAWNEDLLERWRFEPAESFATTYLGSNAVGNTRQLAHQLRLNRQCLAVLQGHRWLFPVFQIDPDTKRPYPEILALIEYYPGMAQSNRSFSLLRWMDQAHSELSGATPMQVWERGERAAVVAALKAEL